MQLIVARCGKRGDGRRNGGTGRHQGMRSGSSRHSHPALILLLSLPALCHAALLGGGGPTTPYPEGTYSAASAKAYFSRRPLAVASRALEIGAKSASFAGALLRDALAGDAFDGPQAQKRGLALTDLLVELGPAFIKIGQSASVRSDLLPPAYVQALTSLQEDVPPFASDEARAIIVAELGQSAAAALLAGLSPEPLAAASLGQVYRGTYEGAPVAVKVQRPEITERIALDMCLVREVAAPLASLLGAPGDVVGIADAWGTGLVDELDYLSEARSAAAFNQELEGGPLEGRVFAPEVVEQASSRRVLTTEWVAGERLDRTEAKDDVPRLASLAMNTYSKPHRCPAAGPVPPRLRRALSLDTRGARHFHAHAPLLSRGLHLKIQSHLCPARVRASQ